MFLTDTTKTDFLHILVRTHLLLLTCQHSCMLLVIIDQIYRKRSRSILIMVSVRELGWCSNLLKNMLTRFFEGPPLGNFCLKTSPLSRNSGLAQRNRAGRENPGYYEHASKTFLPQPIKIASVLLTVT